MEGRSDAPAWAAHDEVQAAWSAGDRAARIDDGESLDDLFARFMPWVASIVSGGGSADTTVAIGHGSLYNFVLPRVIVDSGGSAIAPPQIPYASALVVTRSVDGRLVDTGRLIPSQG